MTKPLAKSLHTVRVIVNVASFLRSAAPLLLTHRQAVCRALEILGHAGAEDPHGLAETAIAQMLRADQATKFAAYDDFTIYAVGDTVEEALAKAREHIADGDDCMFDVARMSSGLAARIAADGWDGNRNSFDVRDGFIVDTTRRA